LPETPWRIFLRSAQRFFRQFALGDVFQAALVIQNLALLIPDGSASIVNLDDLLITPSHGDFKVTCFILIHPRS
jgi:hypothetical protein